MDYEFTDNYAHVMISGQSKDPDKILEEIKSEVNTFKQNGLNEQDFDRISKMIYGEYIKEYNDISNIGRMFLSDYFKGINSFSYLEEFKSVNIEYVQNILKTIFVEENMILSVVHPPATS